MKKWFKKLKKEDGFTLVEMTIVLLVIAILMIVFLPNISGVNTRVTTSTDEALVQTINAQKLLYKAEKGNEPSLEELEKGGYITSDQLKKYNEIPEGKKGE